MFAPDVAAVVAAAYDDADEGCVCDGDGQYQ